MTCALVKNCQFGVSPVNYSNSDSDSDSKNQVYFVPEQADQCLCFQCMGSCRLISSVVLMLDLR